MRAVRLILRLALVVLVAPLASDAQPPAKVYRVGLLMPVPPAAAASNIEAFRQGLRERGYVEGQSIAIESRFADGKAEPLPGLAAELVRLNMDVIVTWGTPAAGAPSGPPRRSPSSSPPPSTPLGLASLPASRGRAGTSQV